MNRVLAIAALVGINVLWGSTYVVAKVAMEQISPTLLAVLRFVIATAVLWLLLFGLRARRGGHAALLGGVAPADRRRLLALGAVGIGVAYLLEYPGLYLTTATDASLMIIGEVLFTTVLAALLLREPLGASRVAGIVFGATGVAVLVLGHLGGDETGGAGVARAGGDLLILAALALQALYTVLGTGQSRRYHPLLVVAWAYTGSLVVWIPVLAWHLWWRPWPSVDAVGVLGVVHLALVASVFCFLVWFAVSRHVGAGIAALSLFVQPLVGATLGVVALGEAVTASTLVGGLLVLVAIGFSTRAAPAGKTRETV